MPWPVVGRIPNNGIVLEAVLLDEIQHEADVMGAAAYRCRGNHPRVCIFPQHSGTGHSMNSGKRGANFPQRNSPQVMPE